MSDSDAQDPYVDEEEQKEKAKNRLDGHLLRRIGTYLKPYTGYVAAALGITLSASFLGPLRPMIVQIAIDQYIIEGTPPPDGWLQGGLYRISEAIAGSGSALGGLEGIILILLGALLFEGLFAFGRNYLTQWIGQHAIYDLRTKVFRHIQKQPLQFFDRTPIGTLITRSTSDVETLSDVLSSGLVVIIGDLFRLVFILSFMFYLDVTLALVTLAVMPLMVAVTFWFRNRVRTQYRETRKQVSRLNSFMQEHVSGMSIVQLFSREDEEMRRYDGINDDHRGAQVNTIFYFAIFWPAIQIIADVAMGLVIWVGGVGAMAGSALTLGTLIAFIQYARMFFEPIRELSNQYNTLQSAMAGAERIFDLVDDDKSLPEKEDAIKLDGLQGRITFENVWFAYEDDTDGTPDWVLKDVSFDVDPGETIALVGATGAGKSTIMNVLLRFYEIQRGRILVDGHDIRDLSLHTLRRHVGLIPQDVFLFSGTVERNLTLDDPSVDEDRMRRAAEIVQADKFIDKLPNGYQQDVKERGASLSHGQRQLLAFVRALLYDPEVMVLDEATSSVDTETEGLIQNALERITEGRTTLAIAHRLSTIQDADQILVMHKGEVRERGTHHELLAHDGLYRRLHDLQYADEAAVGGDGLASGDGEAERVEV